MLKIEMYDVIKNSKKTSMMSKIFDDYFDVDFNSSVVRKVSNLSRKKSLMKSSTICCSMKTYCKMISSISMIFRCQWCWISMCLIRIWKTKFLINVIAFWLSQRITTTNLLNVSSLKFNWSKNSRKKNVFFFRFHIDFCIQFRNWKKRSLINVWIVNWKFRYRR